MLVISKQRGPDSGVIRRLGELMVLYFGLALLAAASDPRVRAPDWVPFMALSVLTAIVTDTPRSGRPKGLPWRGE
jgi:hypothetical protein